MNKTKKRTLIIIGVLLIMATIIACLVIVGNSKVKYTDLISEIDTAWMSAISEDQPEYLTQIDERSSYTIKKIEKDDK